MNGLNGSELICVDTKTGRVKTPTTLDFSDVVVLGLELGDIPYPVTSVFGRIGAVVAAQDDYSFAQLSAKPTTMAGYGITDAQPLDSDLSAIAALATTPFGRALLALADAAAARGYIGAGTSNFDGAFASLSGKPTTMAGYGITDAQPLDADLTAIAALTTTTYGRGFLPLANAAAARTYIGVAAGIPPGGTTGQVLMKNSNTDYDVSWVDVVTPT